MSRYVFRESDLSVGTRLLCVRAINPSRTEGWVYVVKDVYIDRYAVTTDVDGRRTTFDIAWFNLGSTIFYPYDKLTGEEQFLCEMTGKIPERCQVSFYE